MHEDTDAMPSSPRGGTGAGPAPLFTVLLPTFNRESVLAHCIESVRAQTVDDWELVVVDDGSTDGSRQLIEAIPDERIRYFFKQNAGVAVARNYGIDRARGTYVCFIDSDDEFLPNHLEVLRDAIESRDRPVAMLHTLAYEREGNERVLVDDYPRTDKCQVLPGHNPKTTAICIHAEILATHRFNEELTRHSDAELWNRIDLHYPILRVEEATAIRNLDVRDRMSRTSLESLEGWEKTYLLMLRDRANRAPVPRHILRAILKDLNMKMAAEHCVERRTLAAWGRLMRTAWYGPRSLLTRRFYSLLLRSIVGPARSTAS